MPSQSANAPEEVRNAMKKGIFNQIAMAIRSDIGKTFQSQPLGHRIVSRMPPLFLHQSPARHPSAFRSPIQYKLPR
jgi:hypothetical protein